MGGKAVGIAQVSRGQVGGMVGHFCCLDNSWFCLGPSQSQTDLCDVHIL